VAIRSKTFTLLAISLGIFVIVNLGGPAITPLTFVENWLMDTRVSQLSLPSTKQSEKVVVLTITEDTLATLPYRSPLDRGLLADALERLTSSGVKAVAFDILFDQPTEPEKDKRLLKVMADFPAPIVAAWGHGDDGLTKAQIEYMNGFHKAGKVVPAFANLVIDSDKVVRRTAPARPDEAVKLGIAPALYKVLGGAAPSASFPISYRAKTDAGEAPFRSFPIQATAFLPPSWFKGKVVFIGADLPLEDRHATPYSSGEGALTPGVLIHAHILDQLLEGRRLSISAPVVQGGLSLLLILIGVGLAALNIPIVWKVLALACAIGTYWSGGFLLYGQGGPLIPLFFPTISIVISYGVSSAYLGRTYRKERRFIKGAFSRYVSPEIVQQISEQTQGLSLNGRKRELTMIFTDIAGFTSLSENIEPERLISALNIYLDGMSRIVIDHGGTIDKFIGDAVFAFFNAPVNQPDHAQRALTCAVEMDAFSEAFRAEQKAQGIDVGITRIGVHTGEAVVGNVGGEKRFDYTAIGDAVNTAARLEGVNKYLGTRVCISGATAALVPDANLQEIGDIVVKGKTEGVSTFQPVTSDQAKAPAFIAYAEAVTALREESPEASIALEKVLELNPESPLARFHIARLAKGEKGLRIVLEGK
jgi:adenylate cyclase